VKRALLSLAVRFVLLILIRTTAATPALSQQLPELQQRAGLFGALPLSSFSKSHSWGAGLQYQIARSFDTKSNLFRRISLLGDFSLSYFAGRPAAADGYDFAFFDYWRADLGLGLQHQPVDNFRYGLLAGPSLTRYSDNNRIGWQLQLQTQLNLSQQWLVGPAIQIGKASQTEALWSLRVGCWYQLSSKK
jgi:hypothetical protein